MATCLHSSLYCPTSALTLLPRRSDAVTFLHYSPPQFAHRRRTGPLNPSNLPTMSPRETGELVHIGGVGWSERKGRNCVQGAKGGVTMEGAKIKLVGISGSLRKMSCNKGLLNAGLEYAGTFADVEPILCNYSKLPLYNGDLETQDGDVTRFPPEVEEFRELVRSADAFLFAVPEYNYSLPGVTKNAIDWASRPPNCFADRPAAIMGAGGMLGAVNSAHNLRQVGIYLDLHFVNKPELFVRIYTNPSPFDSEGNLVDEKTRERVHEVVDALRTFTYRLKGLPKP